ncbi:MAG TPA: DEAD/DEAH box helicase [Hyphomicrobiaceae bacterium]|jgi:superfamily II DNA or RNA helicase
MIRLAEGDLRGAFEPQTMARGKQLWRGGHVREVDTADDGLHITGKVKGSQGRPYTQTISLVPQAGGKVVRITGYCTCPVGLNCKHVVAVLLEHPRRDKAESARNAAASTPGAGGDGRGLPQGPVQPQDATDASPQQMALSPAVTRWLDRLAAAASGHPPGAAPASKPNQRVLCYVLNDHQAPADGGEAPARVRAVSVRLTKDGGIAEEKHYDAENALRPEAQRARFLTDDDINILRDFMWLSRGGKHSDRADVPLAGDAVSLRAAEAMLASGRLRYGAAGGPVLRPGPEIAAEPVWVKTGRGGQRLAFVPSAGSPAERIDVILPLKRLHYIDGTRGLMGPVATSLPAALAAELARAPEIGAAEAILIKGLLPQRLRRGPDRGRIGGAASAPAATVAVPLPEAPENVEVRDAVVPVPRLELLTADVRLAPAYRWYAEDKRHSGTFRFPLARLAFDYGGETVAHDAPAQVLQRTHGDTLVLTPRHKPAETKAQQRLAQLGLKRAVDPFSSNPLVVDREHAGAFFIAPPGRLSAYEFAHTFDDPSRFIAFSMEAVPQLVQEGWQVSFSDDYPYRLAEGEAAWWADVGEGSGIDWFAFELGVEFEGHRINLVPHLLGLLDRLPREILAAAGKDGAADAFAKLCATLKLYHPLPDGRLLPLPAARLAPILKSLVQLVGPRGDRVVEGKVKLHRAEAAALAAFAEAADNGGLAWAASAERLLGLGRRLQGGANIERLAPPAGFKANLRPYQAEGLSWLGFLREAQFGGVLADDMGLGKTVQALAFLAHEKAAGRLDRPALIVSPTSVLPNWQAEAERFAPELSVLPLRGLERKQLFDQIPGHDVVLTTYPLLARDHAVLLAHEFHAAILDEAQAIKNPKAAVSGLAHLLRARHRLALTGTPLENNLGEVWSLFEFLSPGLLGDESTFRRTFRTPIEKHGDQAAQAFLSRRLKPFMLRRTKEEVATELPPKTEIVEHVRLEGAQRDLYETVRVLMHEKVRAEIDKKGLARSHIVFLDALLKLRQICCDPRLLKLPQARKVKGSAKLERLVEMLPELIAEGRRVLLFSQFTSMLALIEEELAKLKIPHVILTGDTTDRATPVREFQAGKAPLFLLSLKAGGTGLNLTAADTVIHYDPWWNPAVENQATDRAYRIGQDKPVFVYKLIVEEGIEAAIEQLKARKAALAQALFDGASKTPLDLSEADISALFAPLRSEPMRRAA